jgi:Stage II sporulation protein E (SpoIIE)
MAASLSCARGVRAATGVLLVGLHTALLAAGHANAQMIDPSNSPAKSSPGTPLVNIHIPGTHPIDVHVPGTQPINVSVPGIPSINIHVPGTPPIDVHVPGTKPVNVSVPGIPPVNVHVPGPPPVKVPVPPAPVAGSPPPASKPPVTSSESPPSTVKAAVSSTRVPALGPASTPASTGVLSVRNPFGGRPQPRQSSGAQPQVVTRRSVRALRHRQTPNHSIALAAAGKRITSTSHRAGSANVVRAPASHPRTATHATNNPLGTIGRHIPLPIPVPDWSKPIILALLLLAIWFGIRSRLAAIRARGLEGQRATLLQDIGVMQAALVPEVPARIGGLAVSVAYRPADGPAAGGDFYDVFSPEPEKVAIILGDVCGHGHEALTNAALTRYTLRAYIQAGLEPRAVLALAGQVLADPASDQFATVAVGIYDEQSGKLTYASAGHPPPILSGFAAQEPITICSSSPIGWGVPTGLRQTTISLPAGAEVCFFSDGLIEARTEGKLLGRERLIEILTGLGSSPVAADLLERVRAVTQATPDDMAACILQPETSASGSYIHMEELEADAQALAGVHVRGFLQACGVPSWQITQAIKQASDIAAAFDTALLRVERGANNATVTVTTSGSGTAQITSSRRSQTASSPLRQAVTAT